MKEFLKRSTSIILVLASLLFLFLPSIINISGVKASEWRELRNEMVEELEKSEEILLQGIEGNLTEKDEGNILNSISEEQVKEDLKDSGMPYTSRGIKKTYSKIISIVKELINDKVSFKEVMTIALFVPDAIDYMEKMLEFCETETGSVLAISKNDTKELIDSLYSIKTLSVLILVFLLFIILVGLLAAVAEAVKIKFVKYIHFAFVTLVCIALMVGPFILNNVLDTHSFTAPFEEVTIYPNFITLVTVILTAFLSLIAPLFFGKSKTLKTNEQKEEGTIIMEENKVIENEEAEEIIVDEIIEEEKALDASETVAEIVIPKNEVKLNFSSLGEKIKHIRTNNPKGFITLSSVIAAVLVAVIVVGIIFIPTMWNNYKTPLDIELKFINSGKPVNIFEEGIIATNGFAKSELKEIFSIIKGSDDYDEDEILESAEELREYYIDEYGENYKAKYVINDKEELEKDDLRDFKSSLKEMANHIKDFVEEVEDADSDDLEEAAEELGLTRSEFKKLLKAYDNLADEFKDAKISKGYDIEANLIFTGSELDEPVELDEFTLRVYCINGRWVGSSFFEMMSYSFFNILEEF